MFAMYINEDDISSSANNFLTFLLVDAFCLVEDGCEQWTYWADSRKCYLKSSNDSTDDAISGTVGCSSGNTYTF